MTETERVKPRRLYVEDAIALAMESRWQEALMMNQALVERHGPDESAYNRIGKAQTELGNLDLALEAYSKTIELNPLNVIAQNNARKIAAMLETSETVATTTTVPDVDLFAEEPGKSALSILVPSKRVVGVAMAPGDVVELDVSDTRLEVRTGRGVLIGEVDVKLAHRLVPLIEKGNRYTAAVARADNSRIEIMIREEFQSEENAGTPSFPIARDRRGAEFRPYAKESLLAQRGIDAEALDAADVDDVDDMAALEEVGMQTTDDFDDEAAELDVVEDEDAEDEADQDEAPRPEDAY